jgi:DNA repair protein RecO (recombination protein O)
VNPWSDEAIVLGSRKSNESNRVVFLLTREHGRVAAAANGVRKTKSRIGARLEPMNHVEVLVKPGRSLAVIDEVRLVSVHHRLHADLARMSQGMAMLEAVDKITPDHEPVPQIFELLRRALATLDEQKSPLMLAAFYLKPGRNTVWVLPNGCRILGAGAGGAEDDPRGEPAGGSRAR